MKSLVKHGLIIAMLMLLSACAGPTPFEEGMDNFHQQNYQAAFDKLYPLAEDGNADAEYAIGYMFYEGKLGAADKSLGVEWIRKAALQGNDLAEQALGIIYAQANFAPEKA